VEAYLPDEGWRDMDPSFASAVIGDNLVTQLATDGTDRIAEVPDGVRHKVTIKVKAENYSVFNLGNSSLDITYPLQHTFNTVELTGKPVTLAHTVDSTGAGGLIFSWTQHTYTPYLNVGGRIILGQPYEDFITNFPLASRQVTGIWAIFEVADPSGKVDTAEREIVDKLGFQARQGGGTATTAVSGGSGPSIEGLDSMTTLFAPGRVSQTSVAAQNAAIVRDAPQLARALTTLQGIQASGTGDTPENRLVLRATQATIRDALVAQDSLRVLYFALLSDMATDTASTSTQVRAYHDSPRILISSSTSVQRSTLRQVLDLRRNPIRAIAYPDQALTAILSFMAIRGITDTFLEKTVMEETTNQPTVTTATIFQEVRRLGIPLAAIDTNSLDHLAELNLSPEAKARITHTVNEGRLVIVPESMVTVAGQTTVGWWDINYRTGDIVGVGEHGTNQAAVGYAIRLNATMIFAAEFFAWLAGLLGSLSVYIVFLAKLLEAILIAASIILAIKIAWELTKEYLPVLDAAARSSLPFGYAP
jgi:hypothetical protein